ncbi:unnamed protein product, partial [Mesorhabditis belari]|uniref:Toll-interacting protein n=1 Tax=Mesorhabditis belari TaxID=2138241 RepID=A0AAF3EDB1_9BILA
MPGETVAERRKKVLVGELPEDFLRLTLPSSSGQPVIHQVAPGVQVQYAQPNPLSFVPPNTRGRVSVTVIEANLVKNYGLVRMDPYCRVRVGEAVFETPTKISGGRQPVWNRIVHAYLPNGVESVYVQIFDERAFSQDECVGWAHVILPQGVFAGETIDDWFPLSGPQGEGKEGMIHLVLAFRPFQTQQQIPQQQQMPQMPPIREEDVQELKGMFATVDEEVIRSILEQHGGDKNATCNALLEMMS